MRLMISGGGTGGHIYPALAIAEAVGRKYPGSSILYAGNPAGMEHSLATAAGYDFLPLSVAGLGSKNPVKVAVVLAKNVAGVQQARRAIRKFAPDLVIGTGGYACGPLLLAATKLGVPTLLHEQNAVMGKTNRILSSRVDRLCLTFPIKNLPGDVAKKAVQTGLPVRSAIFAANRAQGLSYLGLDEKRPVLLVTGGSQGARSLNMAVVEAAPRLMERGVQVVHLCGEKLFDETAAALNVQGVAYSREAGVAYQLRPYLEHIEQALAAADVVAGRAGASFLAELAAIGRAAVLVPYPFAAGNHQEHNAACFAEAGAACVLKDAELNGDSLWAALQTPLFDIQLNQQMAGAARGLGSCAAAENILAEAVKIIK